MQCLGEIYRKKARAEQTRALAPTLALTLALALALALAPRDQTRVCVV